MTSKHELINQIRITEKEIEKYKKKQKIKEPYDEINTISVLFKDKYYYPRKEVDKIITGYFNFWRLEEKQATLSAQKENIKYLIKRIDDDEKCLSNCIINTNSVRKKLKNKITQLTKEKTELEDELQRMK